MLVLFQRSIGTKGTLRIEEPDDQTSSAFHMLHAGLEAPPPVRSGPVKLLTYPVLLHLDRVHDYSYTEPAFTSDSFDSSNSDVSGIPFDSSFDTDRVVKWRYNWEMDIEDGAPPPPAPRRPVHDRLNFGDGGGRGDRDDGPGGMGRNREKW